MLELAGQEKRVRHHSTSPCNYTTPRRANPSSGQTKPCDRERAQAKIGDFIQQFNIKHHQDREEEVDVEKEEQEEDEEEDRGRGGAGTDDGTGLMTYEHLACSISGHFVLGGDASKQQLHHMTTHRQTHNGL